VALVTGVVIITVSAINPGPGSSPDSEPDVNHVSSSEVIKQPDGHVLHIGGAPPEYQQAVPLVPGEYKPPSASSEAHSKFAQALAMANALAQFNGNRGGFRLYGWANAAIDPSVEQKECVAVEFPLVQQIQFTYLPAGTAARGPQYSGVCADGSTAWVVQDFFYGYGSFTVGYELGEKAIGHDAPPDRVTAATIAGRAGVIISPLIEEGNGQSIVAFALDKGFVVVGAQNLPLSETLKIAEGIRCEGC